MLQMEERLQATQDQLEATEVKAEQQQELIEQAGLASGDQAESGLSAFLDTVEIGGWVAASYLWNGNDPDKSRSQAGDNPGADALGYPFHPDHNSFSLDQLWFVMNKPATVESRGGFHAEIVFGKTAGFLPGGNGSGLGNDNDLYVMGYAEYLTPWGPKFKAGKFWTPIGAEVAAAPMNLNITRGFLYNLFQPIDHEGIMVEQTFDSGFEYGLGLVNSAGVGGSAGSSNNPDNNRSKTGLAHIGWSGEQFSVGLNGVYGNEFAGNDGDQTYLIDAVATWDPTEKFTAWINADFLATQLDSAVVPAGQSASGTFKAWGAAVAGRYAITERLGFSMRGEVINDHDGIIFGRNNPPAPPPNSGCVGCLLTRQRGSDAYSVTGTADYSLTDHLMVRAEVRWDTVDIDGLPDDEFIGGNTNAPIFSKDDQWVSAVEVIYNF
jgi:hypothetical protein